ncbi:MAG: diphthine--ammonia ligase [Candidatus Dormibacteraceae bacterium]
MNGGHALMWSGGKDSALALNRSIASGIRVTRLINFYDADTGRVRFHATRVAMVEAQAAALGIELRAIPSSWREMPERLAAELVRLRGEDFEGVVFGDIHLVDVRAWYEDRVRAAGLNHVEPIWGEPPAALLREFVDGGGRAVITCVDLARLGPHWLGRIIDENFVEQIAHAGVDPCGENGEYHSFAFGGPSFHRPVGWRRGDTRTDSGFSQLDLLPERGA